MGNRFKFRAMIDGKIKNLEGFVGCSLDYFFEMNSKESPVMQSTGLKDKNGVEIFEGDLISMYGEKDPRDYFEVEWNDDMLALVMYRDNSIEFFGDHNSEDLEVIGNIHDNPELMEIK